MLKILQLISNKATVGSLTGNCVRAFATPIAAPTANAADATTESTTTIESDEPIDMENPYEKPKLVCILCKTNISPSYKNVKLLSQFQSQYTGRIYGRHITGLCKKKQEQVEKAISRAQSCALMPSYNKDIDFLHDPKLFNPEKPLRPHKY